MFRKILAGSLVFSVLAGAYGAFAKDQRAQTGGSLPKIGDRHYVIGEGERYSPVKIKKAEGQPQAKYLKDPIQPAKGVKVEKARPIVKKTPPPPVKVARAEKRGQLRFKKLNVSGHVAQPRVEFSRDLLPVDRADEPLPQDFYEKVFLPAKDDNF